MRRLRLFVPLCVLILLVIAVPVHAEDTEYRQCIRPDGSGVLAMYYYKRNVLALVNRQTGVIEFEIDKFDTHNVELKRTWSPDCRYLLASFNNQFVVFDTVQGGRVAVTDDIPVTDYGFIWRYSQYIVFNDFSWWNGPHQYLYVWDIFNNRVMPLVNDELCIMYDLNWDLDRREIAGMYGCSTGRHYEARLYSLVDGSLIGHYRARYGSNMKYRLADDHQFITMAQWGSDYVDIYRRDGTLLANLHTFHTYLQQHALSPDGRYYVVAQNHLRVWDLAALNTDTSIPNYNWPADERVMLGVKFVDNVTVEVTFKHGVTQRWNILTGTQIV